MSLDELAEALTAARAEVLDLTSTTEELSSRLDVSRKIQKRLWMLTVFLGFIMLGGVFVGLYTFQTSNKLNDCINPEGKCRQQQERQTVDVIRRITDANGNGIPDSVEILQRLQQPR